MTKWEYVTGVLVFAFLIVGAIYVAHSVKHDSIGGIHLGGSPQLVDTKTLDSLPRKSASSADTSHLAAGLLPPTNSWLSGMVLQKAPYAVYPLPLSFLAKNNGFEIGLPTITSNATEIAGEHVPGIAASLDATSFKLTRYDKLSATLTYVKGDQPVGKLTLSEGSPFVFYTASQPGSITVSNINPADVLGRDPNYIRYNANGHTYAIDAPNSAVSLGTTDITVSLKKGETATMYAVPGSQDFLKQYASNVLQQVQVSHGQSGNNIQTTFAYKTTNGRPTVFAALPYQTVAGAQIGTYQSIYGQMKLTSGNKFTSSVPAVTASNELDLSKFSNAQKASLAKSLSADVASTSINEKDAYDAGKQLARAANLLSIAEQLHQTIEANRLISILNKAFAARLTKDSFYYDTTLKGVAYSDPSFGSQDFNDHDYHYGYWLYAASILGKYDSSFVAKYKNQLNLLAADIAEYQPSTDFPEERYFDPYTGHSWAGGLGPFADGNDQESSSEAIHAWNGVSMWGDLTDNDALTQTGQWMLANEANTAAKTWRSVDTNDQALKGYTNSVVGIAFGGKRTYATWFSPDPSAVLGIQLIPMDPSMTTFRSDKDIMSSINEAIKNDNYNVSLGDYILMYLSLTNPKKAESLADKQTNIDSGNSKTYMNAFIDTQLDR